MIAGHPSNLKKDPFKPNTNVDSLEISPLSESKKRKATTPISGGVATGIMMTDEKNDFKGMR